MIFAADGTYSHADLDLAARRIAAALLAPQGARAGVHGRQDLAEARIAFFVPPSFSYAATLRGIWRAGGIAVPLAISHPPAEIDYVIRDADAACVVSDPASAGILEPLARKYGVRFATTAELRAYKPADALPDVASSRRALILYTSGTTGRAKGVVTTHANVEAQVETLVQAWGWTSADRLLLVLPLHHVHGIINGLASALAVGAACEILPAFDAERVWQRFASGEISVFTAVPTIYRRLVNAWEAADPNERAAWSAGARRARLMMSGSAALPVLLLERWRDITGHTLLERYGMTELGMALSNPLEPPEARRPGFVGGPLPGVEVRLVGEDGQPVPEATAGEIEVRGPNVFLEYWRRADETRAAFRDGWFRTGDVAQIENGSFRILGRQSIDIIKTGGFKVSALEIEDALRADPRITDCAVVGIPDDEWGERVSACVQLAPGAALTLDELQTFARARLAPYKIPRALQIVEALPRNAMGKVLKPEVAASLRRANLH
ncbi:MAG: acyl-CoA synthetase [Vicinamibacterales bacterium]